MSETIISKEVEETVGMNMEDIEACVNSPKGEASLNDSTIIKEPISTITQEYLEKTCEEIENMNFVEVKRVLKEFKDQKADLVQAKETAEQIMRSIESVKKSAENTQNLGLEIAKSDIENELGTESIESFLEEYDDTMKSLDMLIAKAEEADAKFADIPKTTTFLSKSMLEVIAKNKEALAPSDPRFKHMNIYYNELATIFSSREDMSYIINEIPKQKIMLRRFITSIKKDRTGSVLKNVQKSVTSAFCSSFNVNQMQMFENYLKDLYGDATLAFYTQYVLYQIYNKERTTGKYGKHKWVEVLIMNVMDILTDMYDLPGGKEEFDKQLLLIKEEVEKLLVK